MGQFIRRLIPACERIAEAVDNDHQQALRRNRAIADLTVNLLPLLRASGAPPIAADVWRGDALPPGRHASPGDQKTAKVSYGRREMILTVAMNNSPRAAHPLVLVALTLGAVSAQNPSPEYQVNPSEVSTYVTGGWAGGDAFTPSSSLIFTDEQASILVEVAPGYESVGLFVAGQLLSRSEGAYVSDSGQIFNVPLDATYVSLPVEAQGGYLSFDVPAQAPGTYAVQALLADSDHPDGFILSAPVIVNVELPTSAQFFSMFDVSGMASNEITIYSALGHEFVGGIESSVSSPTYKVDGVATLHVPGVGSFQQDVTVDGVSMQMSAAGSQVNTLWDLFPIGFPVGTQGTLDFHFDDTVSMRISDMTMYGFAGCDKKTDKGKVIPILTTPYWPGAPLTSQQADAQIEAMEQGLSGKATECAPPSKKSWCHSYTFGIVDKGLFGQYVDIILLHNGYSEVGGSTGTGVSVGDVVAYRDAGGNMLHTGRVSAVDAQGKPTKIKSKWGPLGTYEHAPGDVPPSYEPTGGTVTYYHSNRSGGNTLQNK